MISSQVTLVLPKWLCFGSPFLHLNSQFEEKINKREREIEYGLEITLFTVHLHHILVACQNGDLSAPYLAIRSEQQMVSVVVLEVDASSVEWIQHRCK